MSREPEQVALARLEVERAHKKLSATLGTLQEKLRPTTLVNNAWDGVRDKSGELADDALQAVKDRPVAVSGVVAAIALFVAREPLWRLVSTLLPAGNEKKRARKSRPPKTNPELPEPKSSRKRPEGVSA
jgi:hypothetical protein